MSNITVENFLNIRQENIIRMKEAREKGAR